MKRTKRVTTVFLVVLFLSLFIALPSASAAATEVWVNDVKLDSSAYYLANGSGVATTTKPASGGYVYFDSAAGTLTLYNAQIDTLHTTSYQSLLFANGDVEIVLTGASTLQYNNNNGGTYIGIYAQGLLTITGSGSALIQFNNTSGSAMIYGIYSHDMAIASGTLNVDITSVTMTFGIDSYYDLQISGGNTTVQVDGAYASGFRAQTGEFRMTGGTANVTVSADEDAIALITNKLSLKGGDGTFTSDTLGTSSSGGWISQETFSVTGGHFTFIGPYSALRAQTSTCTLQTDNVETYVSNDVTGSGKSLWNSETDDVLLTTSGQKSPYLFVEFIEIPKTGDGNTPWLWLAVAGLCLLLAAGMMSMAQKVYRKHLR